MIVILDNLDVGYRDKWAKQFISPQRQCSEGIWRRTQETRTKEASEWHSEDDARRRIIHFYDEYDVVNKGTHCQFVIKNVYLWLAVSMPPDEMELYQREIMHAANKHGWHGDNSLIQKDGLTIKLQTFNVHPEDQKAGRRLPYHYQTMEITLQSDPNFRPNVHSPWAVLKSGIRTRGQRVNNPHIIDDVGKIIQYAPFQFELGGGASIELGIPPLNHLHQVYQVNDPVTKKFVLGNKDRLIVDILTDYKEFYQQKASQAYTACLLAEPNEFYLTLARLYQKGLAVGDIITNNFDGLTSLVGLPERYVRKYEDSDIVPEVDFDPRAKSLVVVGSHADRRYVQKAARAKGLQIIFVDPEIYVDYQNNIINYPIENIEDGDILLHKSCVQFAEELSKHI